MIKLCDILYILLCFVILSLSLAIRFPVPFPVHEKISFLPRSPFQPRCRRTREPENLSPCPADACNTAAAAATSRFYFDTSAPSSRDYHRTEWKQQRDRDSAIDWGVMGGGTTSHSENTNAAIESKTLLGQRHALGQYL